MDQKCCSVQPKAITAVAKIAPSQAASTRPVLNGVNGLVTFTAVDGGVRVVAELHGLKPDSHHGFHIHEKGDLSAPDLSSAGGHFNPDQHHHGGPGSAAAHAGDLGNITADAKGDAHLETTLSGVTLEVGPRGLVGRSVIVHADADDLKTDPAGNAGPRIAGGVIELTDSCCKPSGD
ncbi:MAG: superoxide dismutase family protein [Phycisphaerales bacterium]|nr:superoxide dismutase family protein [Phycisphaerales bacterium]